MKWIELVTTNPMNLIVQVENVPNYINKEIKELYFNNSKFKCQSGEIRNVQ